MSQNPEEIIKLLPGSVKKATLAVLLFGIFQATRMILVQLAQNQFSTRSLFFAALAGGFFIFNGFGLFTRSKASFIFIVAFSLLLILPLLAAPIHLLALLVAGAIEGKTIEVVASVIGTIQLFIFIWMLIFLLSKEVRQYIWGKK